MAVFADTVLRLAQCCQRIPLARPADPSAWACCTRAALIAPFKLEPKPRIPLDKPVKFLAEEGKYFSIVDAVT